MGTNTIKTVARSLATAAGNELPGTAPPHRFYILLHTSNPPAEYAPRISSKVQRALQLNILKLGGLVNFSWSADQPVFGNPGGVQEMETYAATAFSLFGRLDIPSLSLSNMNQVVEKLRRHADAPSVAQTSNDVHLYVCTHGARDCRCGDRGQLLVTALRNEVARRNLKQVRIGEVGHVGGHKYAANLLVYPHGEWLGNLGPDSVPSVLDAILHKPALPFSASEPPLSLPHWRGRMGLNKDEQNFWRFSHPPDIVDREFDTVGLLNASRLALSLHIVLTPESRGEEERITYAHSFTYGPAAQRHP